MSSSIELYSRMLAAEAAERHRTPKAEYDHPKGVIVPYDALLTENIRDRDYVPYCGPCDPMQRVRRAADGFQCPACGNKTNWDLTPFNGNVDVQFDPEHADPEWLAQWEQDKLTAKTLSDISEVESLLKSSGYDKVEPIAPVSLNDWNQDSGKKNTGYHPCNNCGHSFFGKHSRKYCVLCQDRVTQHLTQIKRENIRHMYGDFGNRQNRRHG